jgi:hypothetical protein
MNERITELEKQCWSHRIDGFLVDGQLHFDTEKFAELIVRECINVVNPTQHHKAFAQSYMGGVDGLELLDGKVKQIKQHFGVEE